MAHGTTSGAEATPENVVLVTVPSLRADRLGPAGSLRDLTPYVDELASRGTLVTGARTPTPNSIPSLASVFTGRRPHNHRVLGPGDPGAGLPTLAERLRAAGLRTIAVVPDPTLMELETFASGFDEVHPGADEPAPVLATRALERLAGDAVSRPFFLWVHVRDCTAPYRPALADLLDLMADDAHRIWRFPLAPAEGERQRDGLPSASAHGEMRSVEFYLNAYDATVRLVDRGVERLHRGLVEAGLDGSTLFILASLHGESLGEHGFWFTHGQTLYEEELRVPVLFVGPGIAPHVESEYPVSLTDIAPTVGGFLDLPRRQAEGEDLSARLRRGSFASSRYFDAVLLVPPFSRALVAERRFKLIFEPPRPPQIDEPEWWPTVEDRELYDLLLDPLEAAPGQDIRVTIANEMELLLKNRYPPVPGTPPAEDRSRRR